MEAFDAIYEDGVFRPIGPVLFPEKSCIRLKPEAVNGEAAEGDDDMAAIYEILDRRHNTGIVDLAARHNEHQP